MSQISLMEQLRNLELLQELDLKIDSIKKNQSSLPGTLKLIDESLNKLRVEMNQKQAQINEIEKLGRQSQAALDINKDRLDRASAKLDAVTKPQEFQAANKEIEQLKKLGSSLEEQNKKTHTDLETAQAELKVLSQKFDTLKGERDVKAESVSGEDHRFQADLDVLISQRTEYTSKVEKRILAQYDRVRSVRSGLGIVPALGGRCKGCNIILPPQLFNEVQKGNELHSCPSCHRFLFVPVAPASASNAAGSSN